MEIVPYEFKPIPPPPVDTYQVTFFCFFDGSKVHHFAHQSDCLENAAMARECGCHVHSFVMHVYVSPNRFPEIFSSIKEYVSSTDSNR